MSFQVGYFILSFSNTLLPDFNIPGDLDGGDVGEGYRVDVVRIGYFIIYL